MSTNVPKTCCSTPLKVTTKTLARQIAVEICKMHVNMQISNNKLNNYFKDSFQLIFLYWPFISVF